MSVYFLKLSHGFLYGNKGKTPRADTGDCANLLPLFLSPDLIPPLPCPRKGQASLTPAFFYSVHN